MIYDLTHASWFSGVGGIDLGLERAGWRTVLHSEIDPYASAVLARHWPGVPNLGDVLRLELGADLPPATLWSGGFPCQDLSKANPSRRGMARGTRSGLAHAFLDLVEFHRPPALLVENVPGLLTSHRGRDLGALVGRLGVLGYWWAYRVLDASLFGVPQRRRRVYLVALHDRLGLGPDGPAEVLSIGTRCERHPLAGDEAGADAALDPGRGIGVADGSPANPEGGREANGVARRVDAGLAVGYRKAAHVNAAPDSPETWVHDGGANTLNTFDATDVRTTHLVVGAGPVSDFPGMPSRLDGHRFRVVGNGVAAPVSQWIGERLRVALEAAC